MGLATGYLNLIDELRERLGDHGYSEFGETDASDVGRVSLIMTPRRWTVRYVCAVAEVPDDMSAVDQCKELCEKIRRFLIRRYARFPWWKELGTYLVLLCPHGLYDRLAGHMSTFHDRTGLHMNVLLGTVFVDRDHHESSADSTWGLFYSGSHFADIQRVVRDWCKRQTVAS